MLVVNFKKLHANTKLPVKGSSGAACHDLYAVTAKYEAGGIVTYGLGFATQIPEGWRAVIVPRSNISKHPWVLANSMGIIDCDYRGEWMVKFRCTSNTFQPIPYGAGDRVAQVYFERVTEVAFAEVEDLDQTGRGDGGFGSTGITDVTYAKPEFVTNTTADVKVNIIN